MVDVTLGIPCFNEAQNISNILDALVAQKGNDEIKIVQIIVLNDGSTDGTETIVNKWARRDRRIQLFHQSSSSRQGKSAAVNEILAHSRGKIVALFDADVLPADDEVVLRLVSPMVRDPSIGVCGGAPCAFETKNLMERVAYFTYTVWNNVRRRLKGGSNLFCVNGRIYAISSAISRRVKIPREVMGEDAYLYFCCLKLGRKVHFASDAIVYYQETQNLHDFLLKRLRYEQHLTQLISIFGNLAKREVAVPRDLLVRCTLNEGLRDPLSLFVAPTLFLLSKLYYRVTKIAPIGGGAYAIATSTKRLDSGFIAKQRKSRLESDYEI